MNGRARRQVTAICLALASTAGHAAPLIAIDIGHSLAHPGATSARGTTEFAFNLALARTLADQLTAAGFASYLVGADGSVDDLMARVSAEKPASFIISLHHDSAQAQFLEPWTWQGTEQHYTDRFSGFSLFVSRENGASERSLGCASAIGARLLAAGMHFTTHHAARIAGESKQWADAQHGVYYYDHLAVLRHASAPAVLLEAGLIVNRADELELGEDVTRARIASAIVTALSDCGALTDDKLPGK